MTTDMNTRTRIILALVILSGAVLLFVNSTRGMPGDSSKWQAVFLSDGQVYFGKLGNHNSRFALLEEVYYLKFSGGLQQGSAGDPAGQLNLIKLGGEAHGPEGRMYIAKDTILFVEDLKETSAVVQAINNRK